MSRSRYHDKELKLLGEDEIEEGLRLCEDATQVNSWYPMGPDSDDFCTVRGPYNRWFRVENVSSSYYISSAHDDVKFAAHAMNNYRDALLQIKELQKELDTLKEHLEPLNLEEWCL